MIEPRIKTESAPTATSTKQAIFTKQYTGAGNATEPVEIEDDDSVEILEDDGDIVITRPKTAS